MTPTTGLLPRALEGGPVRVRLLPRFTTTASHISSPPRIGFDGTHKTPSKELLQSTTASRNQRVVPTASTPSTTTPPAKFSIFKDASGGGAGASSSASPSASADDSMDTSVDSSMVAYQLSWFPKPSSSYTLTDNNTNSREAQAAAARTSPLRRTDCMNPVAWTLWKEDDKEDLEYLLEKDTSHNRSDQSHGRQEEIQEPVQGPIAAFSTRRREHQEPPSPPPVLAPIHNANYLVHVYGGDATYHMARPVPRYS
jgi:hypothetical protein